MVKDDRKCALWDSTDWAQEEAWSCVGNLFVYFASVLFHCGGAAYGMHTRDCGKQRGVYGNKLEYSKDANVHQAAANLSRAATDSQKNLFPISSRDLPRH